jgi:cytochrome c556
LSDYRAPPVKEGAHLMIRSALAVAAIAVGVTVVAAQSDPISSRRDLMKSMGAQTKTGSQMAKGEAPYDQEKAVKVFDTYIEVADKMPTLFPEHTKTGGDTTAAPKVWEDQAGFKNLFTKLKTEATAAKASVKDLDSFKASFGGLTKNCGGCHETYRVKKS